MKEMKDSGIEWIGEIPTDWCIGRIKYNFYLKGRIGWQGLKANEFIDDGPFLVTGTDFENGNINWSKCYHISEERYMEAPEIHVENGDLLITKDGTVGKVAYINNKPEKVSLNSHLLIIRPSNQLYCNKYLFWIIQSPVFDKYFLLSQNGTIMASLSQEKINNFSFPLPSIETQRRIASYLDRKCSQIDAIIARQQEVIEKLKAYKLSVITEAVTKGLNPNVPMKDSGVEWIGEIPKHWRLIKLKNIVGISDGTHDTPAYVDISKTSHPLVTSKCIVNGKIDPSLGNHISQDDYDEINKRSKVQLYDVIMPMIGTVGNPALVIEEPNFAIKNVALLKTRGSFELGKYVLYLLSSNLATVQFDKINRGGVQSFISQEKLKNMIFTLPDSMSKIVVLLDKKIAAIDKVIKQKQMIIDKLINYKKSLIYEVVTGKKEV